MRCPAFVLASIAALAASAPGEAAAFCGFYVSGADAKLFNNATQVALMREGTRTVLSMQNNYQGPPADFAMVVPVPVVLQQENVKTLPRDIFERLDKLSAPRLVEYWEQDPCKPTPLPKIRVMAPMVRGGGVPDSGAPGSLGVTIEAKFTVGEYQVLILSARDSTGLDTWLRQGGYKIPPGAEPYLRPYVVAGMKFFVAKVDIAKVKFEKGMATLSPLRFHYDSELFNLPVRLGLMNSSGTQDLIVNILAPSARYEVANYDNVTIPTNIDVAETARKSFPSFYVSLFDATLSKHPRAVVTEYSWDARSCDPCPTPPLSPSDLATLGADVLPSATSNEPPGPSGSPGMSGPPSRWRQPLGAGFVLTRLHARYSKDALGEDLVFRAAQPIAGGREFIGDSGKLEQGFVKAGTNNFQARYAIRHPWKGSITCAKPHRGRWGGPPNDETGKPKPEPATDLAFAPRGDVKLTSFVKVGAYLDPGFLASAASVPVTILASTDPAPSSAPDAGAPPPPDDGGSPDEGAASSPSPSPPPAPPDAGGCAGCEVGSDAGSAGFAVAGALAAVGLFAARARRSRESSRGKRR
jgi:hypothetical protein